MEHKATHSSQPHGRQGPEDRYEALIEEMPALNRLFEIMSLGENPAPLDVFYGLSQMVAFYTDPDLNPYDQVCDLLKISGNRCISC